MQSTRRHLLGSLAALPVAASGILGAAVVNAQERYPNRALKFIVPFAPGSSTDISARLYGEIVARQLGTTVVVDNRAGAGGNIGSAAAAHSAPDGYTFLYSTATSYAIAPLIYPDLQYSPVRDLLPIAVTNTVPTLLVVSGDSEIKTFQDLMARVKASPDKYSYGSNGVGANSHITCKLVATRMGVPDLLHVPFKNGSQGVMSEIMAGRITYAVDPWSVVGPLVKAGKLRALATTNRKRLSVAPDVPSVGELLRQDFDTTTWAGLWAPTGTSADIAGRLHDAITEARKNAVLVKQLEDQGTPLMPDMSIQQVTAFMKLEAERWKVMIKEAQVTI